MLHFCGNFITVSHFVGFSISRTNYVTRLRGVLWCPLRHHVRPFFIVEGISGLTRSVPRSQSRRVKPELNQAVVHYNQMPLCRFGA
jgi:hypothetical protein